MSEHGRPPSVMWPRSVRLYLVSFLVVGLTLSVLGPALSELRERSGSDIGDIGRLFVGQSLGYVLGPIVGGRLFDRFDGHRVMAGALVVLACGLMLVPTFDGLLGLFVAFTIIGLGASVADLGGNALLIWELGAGGGRAMNMLHLCFGLGALIAPAAVHVGLNPAVRTAAALCVILAGVALTIRSPSVAHDDHTERSHATVPLLAVLGAFFVMYVGFEVGFAGWIHTYGEEIALGSLAATWLTTTFWIGFTLGRLIASAVAHSVTPVRVLTVTCALSVIGALVLVVGDGRAAPVWIGTAMVGLAAAPQFPAMVNRAEQRIRITGAATAWFVGGAGVGGLMFPWLIGMWFDAAGATALPWATLVFSSATMLTFLAADRALRR